MDSETSQFLDGLSPRKRSIVLRLHSRYGSTLSLDSFARLCVLTAKYSHQRLERLGRPMGLAEFMPDSLDQVDYVLDVEEIFGKVQMDWGQFGELAWVITFEDVIRNVEKAVTHKRAS